MPLGVKISALTAFPGKQLTDKIPFSGGDPFSTYAYEIQTLLNTGREGLTGGGTANLDGVLTDEEAPLQIWNVVVTGNLLSPYQLQVGTTAQSLPNIVRPLDFDAGNNPSIFQLLGFKGTQVVLTGTAGGGYVEHNLQSGAPSTPTDAFRLYADASSRPSWIQPDGYTRTLSSTLTASRVYTLPDVAGTFILNTNPAGTTLANINSITSTAGANLVLALGTGGTALTLTTSTLAATFAGPVSSADSFSVTANTSFVAIAATGAKLQAQTTWGAVLAGFGTTNDVSIFNRAGALVMGVTANTTAATFAATVTSTGAGYTNSGFQVTNTTAGNTWGMFVSNADVLIFRDVTGAADLFQLTTLGAITLGGASSITAATTTNLTLAGGSSGASLALFQGEAGYALIAGGASGHTRITGSLIVGVAGSAPTGPLTVQMSDATTSPSYLSRVIVANADTTVDNTAGILFSQSINEFGAGVGAKHYNRTGGSRASHLSLFSMTGSVITENARLTGTGNLLIGGTTDITGSGGLKVFGTTAATSTTTGSLINAGGFGNAGAAYIGGQLVLSSRSSGSGYGWTDTNGTVTLGSYISFAGSYGGIGTSSAHDLVFFTGNSAPWMTIANGTGLVTLAGNLTVSGTGTNNFAGVSLFTRTGMNGLGSAAAIGQATDARTAGDALAFGFVMQDSAATAQTYASIVATITDPTAGSEDSTLTFNTVAAGAPALALTLTGANATVAGDLTVTGGNVGVGTAILADRQIGVGAHTGTASTLYGGVFNATLPSTTTVAAMGIYAQIQTVAASFTLSSGICIKVVAPSVGAGSAITTQTGIVVENQGVTGVTNAYGIDIAAQSGASTTNVGLRNAGITLLTNATTSTSATTGALVVTGGIGVAANCFFGEDVFLAATKKLYLDSGSNTYIHESSADVVQIVTAGTVSASISAATVTFNGDLIVTGGNVGVGTAALASVGLQLSTTTLSGANQYGLSSGAVFSSSATATGYAGHFGVQTAAAAFTMPIGRALNVYSPTIGAASAVTTLTGLYIDNQGAAGIANAYGIDIAAQSGASSVNVGLRNAGTTQLTGNVGVGAASNAAIGMYILSSALAGTQQHGVYSTPTVSSAATTWARAVTAQVITAAASFTCTDSAAFYAFGPTLGGGSAITTQYGLHVANQGAAGVTNAIGVDILAQSGAATLNIGLRNAGSTVLSGLGDGTLSVATGVVTSSSDARLKNIVGSFTRGLADVLKLKPISFTWRPDETGIVSAYVFSGFTAQNVQEAIPEAVTQPDPRGYLGVQDRPIIAALVNSVRELKAENDALRGEVELLKAA